MASRQVSVGFLLSFSVSSLGVDEVISANRFGPAGEGYSEGRKRVHKLGYSQVKSSPPTQVLRNARVTQARRSRLHVPRHPSAQRGHARLLDPLALWSRDLVRPFLLILFERSKAIMS